MEFSFAEKYRPRSFDEIVGQGPIVEQLRGFVQRGQRRHVLLSGPSGSGKTTLAKLYAKSLQCLDPNSNGQFCNACAACKEFGSPWDFHDINCGLDGGRDVIKEYLEFLTTSPQTARLRVYFFDEAHRLSREALAALLVPLEIPSPPSVFIFSTIDEEVLPESFRARCRLFKVTQPTEAEAAIFLTRICQAEELTFEPEAMQLMLVLRGGFRTHAGNLERVAGALSKSPRHISVQLVRDTLMHDRSHRLIAYFDALDSGDIGRQLEQIEGSLLTPTENLRALQDMLIYLGCGYIGPYEGVRETGALGLLIDQGTWRRLAKIFADRAIALKIPLLLLFDEVLDFWTEAPETVTAQTLSILLIRFNNLMQVPSLRAKRTRSVPPVDNRTLSDEERLDRFRNGRGRVGKAASKMAGSPTRAVYLDWDDAQEFYEAATFLVQETGRSFNTRIVLNWTALGHRNDKQAAVLCGRLTNDLRLRLVEWGGVAQQHPFVRIVLHERISTGAFTSTIVAHIPEDLHGRAKTWLYEHRVSVLDMMKTASDGVFVDMTHIASTRGRMQRHWELVRMLWHGVDPEIRVKQADGSVSRLLDVLKVGVSRRAAGVVNCRRYSVSQSIGRAGRIAANADRLPHWSCFQEARWSDIFNGWEQDVFALRNKERKARIAQLKALQQDFVDVGPSLNEIYSSKLKALKNGWSWPDRRPVQED
ncbi:MAG: AAA family ATPase [Pseudomonadota bacterium]